MQLWTLDEDGDELDVLMITDQPLTTGIWMKAKILGVMKFVDGGEVDDKIICVPADDRNNGDTYNTLEDLPKQTLEQIRFHFNHYKDLKKHVRALSQPRKSLLIRLSATKLKSK